MKHLVEFELALKSDNDAFVDHEAAEVARILRSIATSIDGSSTYCEGDCVDLNGNRVGSFHFQVNREDE